MDNKIRIKNKKASFKYFLEDRIEAGIQLSGTEIKSIRLGKANLAESYCTFKGHELFVMAMHIAEYDMGNIYNHEPKRDRKLLLSKRELKKLSTKVREKGYTIVPTVLYINSNGLAKLEIALAKGKHTFDKREDLKKKDINKEIDRNKKY